MGASDQKFHSNGAGAVVLIVQNGVSQFELVCRHVEGRYRCKSATTIAAARQAISGKVRIVGAVLDVSLPDGSGFELLDELRALNPNMPMLFLTSLHDANAINRAHLEDVPLVARRNCAQNLKLFAAQVTTAAATSQDSLDDVLAQLTFEKRLSMRESQILAVAAAGIPRAHIARRLGTSENTIKSQIRSLLEKTQKSNLSEVVWLVHSRTAAN